MAHTRKHGATRCREEWAACLEASSDDWPTRLGRAAALEAQGVTHQVGGRPAQASSAWRLAMATLDQHDSTGDVRGGFEAHQVILSLASAPSTLDDKFDAPSQ